jgi:hypothetical protein
MAVRGAIFLTLVVAIIAYPFDEVVAKSLVGGGLTGILAFWIEALRTEKLAKLGADKVKSFAYRWAFVRMVLYAVALVWAHTLDRDSTRGLLSACVGLFIIRLVIIILGITGLDLSKERKEADGEHR